jgi:opacity protein-like surface antigen
MQFNKKRVTTLLAATLLSTTLSASDVAGVLELKYGIADGKATSYVNTASDTTSALHLSFGAEQKNYNTRTLINFKPLRWEDAEADLISLGVDYIQSFSDNTQFFGGIGLGTMRYEAQDMRATETVYTAQAGINYTLTNNFYATANINYIYTNDIRIQKSQYVYSELEDLLGVEVGIGLRW